MSLKPMDHKSLQKPPLSLWKCTPHIIHQSWVNHTQHPSHTFAQLSNKLPTGYMGCPTFTQINYLPVGQSPPPSICLILGSTTPSSIQIQSGVFQQYTGQTGKHR